MSNILSLKRLFNGRMLFQPTLAQSWLIIILICVGGSFLAILLSTLLLTLFNIKIVGSEVSPFWQLGLYILQFIPAFIYIFYKEGKADRNKKEQGMEREDAAGGNTLTGVTIFKRAALAVTATLLAAFATSPLSDIIQMPESLIENIYKPILEHPFASILTSAIAAPIIEEFILRGTILRGLLTKMRPIYAILWSSALFALMHMNFYQAAGAFTMGLLFSWVYYKSGSLLLPILMHIINNGMAITMLLLFPESDPSATLQDLIAPTIGQGIYFAVLLAAGALLFLTIYLIKKEFDKNELQYDNGRKEEKIISD